MVGIYKEGKKYFMDNVEEGSEVEGYFYVSDDVYKGSKEKLLEEYGMEVEMENDEIGYEFAKALMSKDSVEGVVLKVIELYRNSKEVFVHVDGVTSEFFDEEDLTNENSYDILEKEKAWISDVLGLYSDMEVEYEGSSKFLRDSETSSFLKRVLLDRGNPVDDLIIDSIRKRDVIRSNYKVGYMREINENKVAVSKSVADREFENVKSAVSEVYKLEGFLDIVGLEEYKGGLEDVLGYLDNVVEKERKYVLPIEEVYVVVIPGDVDISKEEWIEKYKNDINNKLGDYFTATIR